MSNFSASELIINPDGSIYHLHLKPEQVAEHIIFVGDPYRVEEVSKHFDRIEHKVAYREFVTHTGFLNNKRLSVISTGIGTDNIDIVLTELDALVNIDFNTRKPKEHLTSLQIVRIGTSGSVQEDIPIDSLLISEMAIGMDGLLCFYKEQNNIHEKIYLEAFNQHIRPHFTGISPYIASGNMELIRMFEDFCIKGTTITATGFYAPQGRILRAGSDFPNFIEVINSFKHTHYRITNLEMETGAIYGLGNILGHRSLSVNAILANRITHEFSANPKKIVADMIEMTLDKLTKNIL